MKKFIVLAGFLLLLLPAGVQALDCAQLSNAQPISKHYIGITLQRTRDGISYAQEAQSADDFFSLYLPSWAVQVGGTIVQLIDSRQALTIRATDLRETTACLRYDQLMLECAIEDVQKEMNAQINRGSFIAIMRLQSLLLYLQERLFQFSEGAQDGRYNDPTWFRQWFFDRYAQEVPGTPLCPFHSDYTPPRMTGYGCDTSVMERILSDVGEDMLPFMQAELEGLQTIETEIDRFREILPLLDEATSESQSQSPQLPPVGDREHKELIGCIEVLGKCSDNEFLVCGSDEFCASKGAGTCDRDTETPTIPKRELRGPFSFPTDHLSILRDFVEKRIQDGLSRTFPDEWARTEDLALGTPERDVRIFDDPFLTSARTSFRIFFRSMSGIQGRLEGAIFPEATDSQLEIADALSDMRESIGELSRLAVQKTGVRAFTLELAYFLRRTCAFRPCQRILEQLMRISLEDECFPYTDGEFLSDSEEEARWKKCAEAACIQVDGVQLPSNCSDILPPD